MVIKAIRLDDITKELSTHREEKSTKDWDLSRAHIKTMLRESQPKETGKAHPVR